MIFVPCHILLYTPMAISKSEIEKKRGGSSGAESDRKQLGRYICTCVQVQRGMERQNWGWEALGKNRATVVLHSVSTPQGFHPLELLVDSCMYQRAA